MKMTPIQRREPKHTTKKRIAEDIHIVPRSKRFSESESSPCTLFEAKRIIPRQRVSKNTLLPAVFAMRIPACPRAPLRTATNFSGSVVEKDRTVRPRTVPERWRASQRLAAAWDRMYPERERETKPRKSWRMWYSRRRVVLG